MEFKEFLELRNLNHTTITNYLYMYNSFESRFNQLDEDSIRRFLYKKNYPGYKHFLKLYLEFKKSDLKVPKGGGRKPKRLINYLEKEQIESLVSECALRDRLLILIMFEGGLRVSELLSLKKENISFRSNRRRAIGKGNKEFISNITKVTSLDLAEYCKLNNIEPEHKLFPDLNRIKVYRILMRLGRNSLGKPLTPHMLRHSCGTNLRLKGVDLRVIQEYLRHEKLETVKVYTHVTREEVEKAWSKAMGLTSFNYTMEELPDEERIKEQKQFVEKVVELTYEQQLKQIEDELAKLK